MHTETIDTNEKVSQEYIEQIVKEALSQAQDLIAVGNSQIGDNYHDVKDFDITNTNDHVMGLIDSDIEKRLREIKKSSVGREEKKTSRLSILSERKYFSNQIITPPLDFNKLEQQIDRSPILKACIDCMVTNTNFGYDLDPVIDTVEREVDDGNGGKKRLKIVKETGEPLDPAIEKEMKKEKNKIKQFLSGLSLDVPFRRFLWERSYNYEVFGNAFWEWERNPFGELVGASLVDTKTVRILKQESSPFRFTQKIKDVETNTYIDQTRTKRFRKFIQRLDSAVIYFKEFGDPRMMDASTGEYLTDDFGVPVLTKDFPSFDKKNLPRNFVEATEIMQFKIYHTNGPYGQPRYAPATKQISGTYLADMVNLNLLNGNAIPPVLLIVEGAYDARLQQTITEHIEAHIKGPQSFAKMLVIQVDRKIKGTSTGQGSNVSKPTIRVEKLSDVISEQGMFEKYIRLSDERTISVYRLPNLFVGRNNDINRATAQISKEISEEQVFVPLRDEFDEIMNEIIFAEMGFVYWTYKSKTSKLDNSEALGRIIHILSSHGGLVPMDVRRLASEILHRDLKEIPSDWSEKPIRISEAEIRAEGMASLNAPKDDEDSNADDEITKEINKGLIPDIDDEESLMNHLEKVLIMRNKIAKDAKIDSWMYLNAA